MNFPSSSPLWLLKIGVEYSAACCTPIFNPENSPIDCERRVFVIKELTYNLFQKEAAQLFAGMKEKVMLIEIQEGDVSKARTICRKRRTPFNDTLHAVLAHRHNAAYYSDEK